MAQAVTAPTSSWNRRSAARDALRELAFDGIRKCYTEPRRLGIRRDRISRIHVRSLHRGDVRKRAEPAGVIHAITYNKFRDTRECRELRPEHRSCPHLVHDD